MTYMRIVTHSFACDNCCLTIDDFSTGTTFREAAAGLRQEGWRIRRAEGTTSCICPSCWTDGARDSADG